MENLISRYRNVTILVAVLFAQVLGLAVQVKRSAENESTRLIRIWAVDSVSPLEKAIVSLQHGSSGLWHNYFYLRGVRQENRELRQEIQNLEIEQARLRQDAEQARRLQMLLGFKEKFIAKTLAAQVIGSSGSEQSRSIYIDKGTRDGIRPDMAVITADGIVGKVLRVFKSTSQVLLINDQSSGVGAILEKSRLQGVLRGTAAGEVVLEKVMSDEAVEPGEKVLSSGGDQIFPKGLAVGTVTKVSPGPELFLNIRVRPAADLSRLEEVLVITQEEERQPEVADNGHKMRAADILAQRLPSIPDKPTIDNPFAPPPPTSGLQIAPAPGTQAKNTGSAKPNPDSAPQGSANGKPASAAVSGDVKTGKPPKVLATSQSANASNAASGGNAIKAGKTPAGAGAASTTNSSNTAKPKTSQSQLPAAITTPGDEAAPVSAKPVPPSPASSPSAPVQDQSQTQDQPQ